MFLVDTLLISVYAYKGECEVLALVWTYEIYYPRFLLIRFIWVDMDSHFFAYLEMDYNVFRMF